MLPDIKTHPILEITGLKKYFPVRKGFWQKTIGWIRAVDGIDLILPPGQTLGLVGESGCGKSTLAKTVLKLLNPDRGKIYYKNRDITALKERRIKEIRKEIQIVFQDPYGSLNPKMSVGATIEDGLRVSGWTKRKRKERIQELLATVGLGSGSERKYPHEFSGGQCQRIGLARALSVEPSIIICDEPVSALDVSIQAQIINLLQKLQREFGLSYFFISHDLNVVSYLSTWVAVMYLGQIMEYALAEEIFDHPRHPYTQALLASVPSKECGLKKMLPTLSGEVPNPMNPPTGCRFQPRCPIGEEICQQKMPDLERIKDSHLVRCWKAG